MNLTIRGRLILVVLLSLLPVGLLAYLFVAQSQKDIAFAEKELLGARYFAALAGDLAAVSGSGHVPQSADFDAARADFDVALGTGSVSAAYAALREKAPAPTYSPETSQALLALLAKVGDASNLILDPDLDSFYVMDMLVTKVPAAMDASAGLMIRLQDLTTSPSEDNKVAIVAALGAFNAVVAGTQNSLASGIAGNADGKVEASLSAPTAAFATAAADLVAVIGADGPDQAKAAALQVAFVAKGDALNAAVNAELSRLLQARVDGFGTRLTTMLSVAGGLVLLVFGTCFLFIRSILRTIRTLEREIMDVADQSAGAAINAKGRDEIGKIARAVAHLQERTVERLQAAERLRAAGQEEASRADLAAAKLREQSLQSAAETATAQRRLVADLSRALQSLADGDLDCRIEQPFEGELEAVRLAFNQTVDGLEDVVEHLRINSSALRTATGEILAGSNDLAQRSAQQTSTIEDTNASVRQLTEVVQESTALVSDASRNGAIVNSTASETAKALDSTARAMSKISESSARISNIIGVIDDIAFQTNLLALNASVEAARAGDVGKGFAVVAVEVRRLAQSAASASADVKKLIEESGGYVAEGAKLVAGTTELLGSMLGATSKNGELLDRIAAQSSAQTSAIAAIRKAFGSIEEMTQHNAALVEETNAAIEQTEAQANDLDGLVGRFRSAGESKLASAA